MFRHRNSLAIIGGALLAAAAAAWTGTAALAGEGHEAEKIELVMTEFAFRPEHLTLEAGKTYLIRVVNKGTVEHELMIGRGGHAAAHGYKENFFEGIGVKIGFEGGDAEVEGLEEIELERGGSVDLVVTVPEGRRGEWEIGCFLPGHYELGMQARLHVR